MTNCKNCSAPIVDRVCKHCGTRYDITVKPVLLPNNKMDYKVFMAGLIACAIVPMTILKR